MLVYGRGGWVRVDADEVRGLPGPLYFRLGEDGQVTEVHLAADTGREITAGHLRGIPLGRLRAIASGRPDLLLAGIVPGAPDPGVLDQLDDAFPKRRPRRALVDIETRLSPPIAGLDDDFLRQVAKAYSAAVARGESPNLALAEQVGHQRTRTVERWVYLARKRGFLPKVRSGAVG